MYLDIHIITYILCVHLMEHIHRTQLHIIIKDLDMDSNLDLEEDLHDVFFNCYVLVMFNYYS